MKMADIKKFLDQGGVSTLWGKIATNLKAEEDRAKLAEEAALKAEAEAVATTEVKAEKKPAKKAAKKTTAKKATKADK